MGAKQAFIEITDQNGGTAARFFNESAVLSALDDQAALVAVLNSMNLIHGQIVSACVLF